MRPDRLLAIAIRDLKIELSGRRGWLLPLIAALILLPVASAPEPPTEPLKMGVIRVSGDVPAEILALDRVVQDDVRSLLHFSSAEHTPDGKWEVRGDFLPQEIRDQLDLLYPGVHTEVIEPSLYELPGRSLFLALVAASILTGAISQSLPGERAQHTLETLLTTGTTRLELVMGKWLAWTGFGSVAALLACGVALVLGRQPVGWWLLPVPLVSAGTVALGFLLVRRANDVIGGATVALRVLPAALTALGLAAWWIGGSEPYTGALIPLGGALVAAGNTWDGAGPPLVATASTALFTAIALGLTTRDLTTSERAADDQGQRAALIAAGLAALAWWTAIVGPLLWAAGGNPAMTDTLAPEDGLRAAVVSLGLLLVVKIGRSPRPLDDLGLVRPSRAWSWAAGLVVGVALATTDALGGVAMLGDGPLTEAARFRLAEALTPAGSGVFMVLATALCVESLFRGWVARQASPWIAAVAATVVLTPLDPLHGAAVAALLTGLLRVSGGSVLPGLLAHAVWALWPVAWSPGPLAGALIAVGGTAALLALAPPDPP